MGRREKLIHVHQMKAKLRVCLGCGRWHYKDVCPACLSESWRAIEDDEYRNMLESLTGKRSCAEMDAAELQRIEFKFQNCGWVDTGQASHFVTMAKRRLIGVIFTEGQRAFGPDACKARIEGFLESKTGNRKLIKASDEELRMVIGWLRRAQKHSKTEEEQHG